MNKEIKDYLPYYLPVAVELNNGGSKVYNRVAVAVGNMDDEYAYVTLRMGKGKDSFTHSVLFSDPDRIKLILRPLSDMTEVELDVLAGLSVKNRGAITHYLLSKHFDIFNLIPEELALDQTKLNER